MVGDAFSYMKEYDEIAAVNKKNGDFHSADEFLSGFKKTDRLHPVISLCVYYGESEWDGPFSLKDMLEIPEKIEPLVSDYHMNLVQVRSLSLIHIFAYLVQYFLCFSYDFRSDSVAGDQCNLIIHNKFRQKYSNCVIVIIITHFPTDFNLLK